MKDEGLAICKKCGVFESGILIRKDRWKCPVCKNVQTFKCHRDMRKKVRES
jgi:hypothetical protein